MNKKIIFFLASFSFTVCHAQVYKCTDLQGNVAYGNTKSYGKNKSCIRTDIDDFEKSYSVNSGSHKNSGIVQTSFNPGNQIKNDEQKTRDDKRLSILTQELKDEETQRDSVKAMIANIKNSNDEKQKLSLQEMLSTHDRNIKSLKRELKIPDNEIVVVSQSSIKTLDVRTP